MSGRDADARGTPSGQRRRIIRAFFELVAEHGYEGVDFAMIGDSVGTGTEAVSRHFPDRCACFTAAWDGLERAYLERLRVVYDSAEGWREQLRLAAWETARLVEANPAAARFLIVETLAAGRAGQLRHQALAGRLAALLERAHLGDPVPAPPATSGWVVGIFFDRLYRCVSTGRQGDFAAELPQLMFLAVSAFAGAEAGLAELAMSPPKCQP